MLLGKLPNVVRVPVVTGLLSLTVSACTPPADNVARDPWIFQGSIPIDGQLIYQP